MLGFNDVEVGYAISFSRAESIIKVTSALANMLVL